MFDVIISKRIWHNLRSIWHLLDSIAFHTSLIRSLDEIRTTTSTSLVKAGLVAAHTNATSVVENALPLKPTGAKKRAMAEKNLIHALPLASGASLQNQR